MANKNQKPHAIMISFHLQGHIIPFVNLAVKLASKGLSVTFAHLEFIHHQISKSHHNTAETDIFAGARHSGLDIRYTTFSDGFPVDFDSVWPEKIAEKYGLVNVSFWTEPALVFSLYYHLPLLRENGHVPVDGRKENVGYVPGVESINTKDFMSYFHYSELQMIHTVIFGAFDVVKKADFVLCNTVEELEEETISALQQKQRFFAVGPLFPAKFSENSVARCLLPESDCTEWLKLKPFRSVLYVSFGSLAKTEKKVILEIAGGLLLCEVSFIWVLRPGIVEDSDGGGVLPQGFEESTRDRGMIVPWCNQNRVLSDPAIGGFITHCGWNSILESVWCNVPMICYPLFTDQITNRKLVVDDWRVGLNLCDGDSITKEEVAEKIGILMNGERSDDLRHEIKKVRSTLQNALSEDGSSQKNFDCFVHEMSNEITRRCKTDLPEY